MMNKELLEKIDNMIERIAMTELYTGKSEDILIDKNTLLDIKKELELKALVNFSPSEALEILGKYELKQDCLVEDLTVYDTIKQALQRLNKYDEILSKGRLTDRNYKNTTLDIDSCKPYLRLGELEDIYEESKHNE